MGKELNKFTRRREAQKRFDAINNKRELFVVLHYSCESFYDIKDGHTPRVTSIAARNLASGQTSSFSIHKSAEQDGIPQGGISEHYDALERNMLDEFFDYLKSRSGYSFIHWNMRDINYGFQAIEHRYKVLGGFPFVIDDSRKFDLAKELIALYSVTYAPHGDSGRLHSLMALNSITAKDVLTGAQEAKAFDEKEFVKLHQSTLRKVDVMANILERVFDGSLKTKASWQERNGIHPAVLIELLKEHWGWSVFLGLLGSIGLAASLKELL